ncbi:MAG: hypothetical protein IT521_07145 [Burkholderiales bacterium]|nr:hypothetical protein [Burkholderiales bacterium]
MRPQRIGRSRSSEMVHRPVCSTRPLRSARIGSSWVRNHGTIESSSLACVRALVEQSDYVTLLPMQLLADHSVRRGVTQVTMQTPMPAWNVAVIYRAHHELSGVCLALFEELRSAARESVAVGARAISEVVGDAVCTLRRRIRDGAELRGAVAARGSVELALVPARVRLLAAGGRTSAVARIEIATAPRHRAVADAIVYRGGRHGGCEKRRDDRNDDLTQTPHSLLLPAVRSRAFAPIAE